ncbi:hypothetical protein THRCLA_08866, partial [Thraustotheca clavata]
AEFLEVLSSVLSNIKDKRNTPSKESEVHVEASYRLLNHFFGKNGKKKITSKEFIAVIQSLKEQLLKAEFDLYASQDPKDGKKYISVHDFAVTLISCLDPKYLPSLLPRLQQLTSSDERVSWTEFVTFHSVIQNHLDGIKLAFELRPDDEVNEDDFIKAALIVSGIRLPEHIMAMVFRVFDENGNGTLDEDELLKILATRNKATSHKSVPMSRPAKFWAYMIFIFATYMQRGFFDELRKLMALDLHNEATTVLAVKSQVRLLQQQTLLCRPKAADCRDVGLFLQQFVPLITKLMATRRQVQMAMLTWIVSLNHVFGKEALRDLSTAIVAGVLTNPQQIRRAFCMKTLIHATRFDCNIFFSVIHYKEYAFQSSEFRSECHWYISLILEEWPVDDEYSHFDYG